MHNLPVVWRLATSALLLLLHTGHHVTKAQNNFGNMTEVNRTLVLERTVTVNPTSVKYGETVTIKCNLKVMVGLSNSVYHLWLYQKSLPVRMAAFHPQSTNEEGYPRELVAHPNGIRCYESNPKSESTRASHAPCLSHQLLCTRSPCFTRTRVLTLPYPFIPFLVLL